MQIIDNPKMNKKRPAAKALKPVAAECFECKLFAEFMNCFGIRAEDIPMFRERG